MNGEVVFLDKLIGPDVCKDLVLADDRSRIIDEVNEQIKRLWADRHVIGTAIENTALAIYFELTKA